MSKTLQIIIGIVIIVIIIVLLFVFSGRKTLEGTIKIGASLPLTGPIAQFGEWEVRGMQLAVEEINTSGGINGAKIELITEDDKALPGEAQKTLAKLLNVNNVDYVIAGTTATAPVAASVVTEKIIIMSAHMPESVEQNENIFSMMPSLNREMRVLADHIYNTGLRDISILYVNNDLGLTCKNKLQNAFLDLGGQVLEVETFGLLDADYRTQLTKIKDTNSQGLAIIMSGGGLGNIIKQAEELNLGVKYFGQTITESPVFLNVAGNLANGIIYTYPFKLDKIKDSFLEKYKSKYNQDPEMYSTAAYDAIYTIAKLVEKCARNCNPSDVMKINFNGAAGRIEFDKDKSRASDIYLKTVKDGAFIFME